MSSSQGLPEVATALLFDRRGRLLIYLRDDVPTIPFPNHWDLFGGHVESGESPESALGREIQEELGVSVAELAFLRRYECLSGDVRPNVKHVYRAAVAQDAEELHLYEGRQLRAIALSDRHQYRFANILASIVDDYARAVEAGLVGHHSAGD